MAYIQDFWKILGFNCTQITIIFNSVSSPRFWWIATYFQFMRRAPEVTLLTQTSKFHFPSLALIFQALFKFSLFHETFPDSPFSLVNASQMVSTPFLCKDHLLTWTASFLFHSLPQTSLGPETLLPADSAPQSQTNEDLNWHNFCFFSSSEGVVCCVWPGMNSLGCPQEHGTEASFLFAPPACTVSLDKDLRCGSLVLTAVSLLGRSMALEPVFQLKLSSLTKLLTTIFCNVACIDLYGSLYSTCWPVSADEKSCNHVLTSHLGTSEIDSKIMFFGLNDGASSQLPHFILVSPI